MQFGKYREVDNAGSGGCSIGHGGRNDPQQRHKGVFFKETFLEVREGEQPDDCDYSENNIRCFVSAFH